MDTPRHRQMLSCSERWRHNHRDRYIDSRKDRDTETEIDKQMVIKIDTETEIDKQMVIKIDTETEIDKQMVIKMETQRQRYIHRLLDRLKHRHRDRDIYINFQKYLNIDTEMETQRHRYISEI